MAGSGSRVERLGEFNLQNYLSLILRSDSATKAAEGWDGDHYDVYASSEASAVLLRFAMRSDEEAAELAEAVDDMLRVVGAGGRGEGWVPAGPFPKRQGLRDHRRAAFGGDVRDRF